MHPPDLFFRLGLALVMGTIIGVERQRSHHTAGLRTNALVTLGAAIYMTMAISLNGEGGASRVAAQIISGIGFLGGGVILRDGFHVRGLNTAATLWCGAAVGTLAGLGMTKETALATVAVLFVNVGLRPISRRIGEDVPMEENPRFRLSLVCPLKQHEAVQSEIQELAKKEGYEVLTQRREFVDDLTVSVVTEFAARRGRPELKALAGQFDATGGIQSVDWKRL